MASTGDKALDGPASAGAWERYALPLVLLLAIYRLAVLALGDIPLDTEEVYYLSWSDRLDLGYFSKPPLLAAMLALVTGVFGESVFVIKSISVLMHTATALVVWRLGSALYDERSGAVAALVFQAMPIVGVISMATTTDAPLLLFWSLTLLGFVHALRSDAWRWWLFTGLMAGLGLLSKYTMGVLAVGLLLFLLLQSEYRASLRSPGLWLGLFAALLVWSPNLWWLSQHDFITLSHTRHISGVEQAAGDWISLRDFLLSQIGVFGPVSAVVLLLIVGRASVWREPANRLLLLASLPLLLVISLQSYLSEANMNWASPAYIGLGIVVTAWMLQHARRWLLAGLALNLALLSLLYHYHALADLAGIQLTRKSDPYFKRLGWRELGTQLLAWRRQYPQAALLSADRKLLAQLGYHSRELQRPLLRAWNPDGQWGNQYDLYNDIADHPHGEFLLLSERPLNADVLQRFSRAQLLDVLQVKVYADLQLSVHVYRVSGFKGYR